MDFKEDNKVSDDKELKGHKGQVGSGDSNDLDTFLWEMENPKKRDKQDKEVDDEER